MMLTKTDDENPWDKNFWEIFSYFEYLGERAIYNEMMFLTQYVIKKFCNCSETTHIKRLALTTLMSDTQVSLDR